MTPSWYVILTYIISFGLLHNGHLSVDTFNVGQYASHDRHCVLIDLVIRYIPFAWLVIGYMPSMWITITKAGFTWFSLSSWEATWDLLMSHIHRSLTRSILAANQGLPGVFHGWHCNPFNSDDAFKQLVPVFHYFGVNFQKSNFPISTTAQMVVCALALCAAVLIAKSHNSHPSVNSYHDRFHPCKILWKYGCPGSRKYGNMTAKRSCQSLEPQRGHQGKCCSGGVEFI